jgi:hypothetical protein
VVTEYELVETNSCNEAEYDDPNCCLNSLEALRFFLRGCCFLIISHNLIFNFLVINKFKLLNIGFNVNVLCTQFFFFDTLSQSTRKDTKIWETNH